MFLASLRTHLHVGMTEHQTVLETLNSGRAEEREVEDLAPAPAPTAAPRTAGACLIPCSPSQPMITIITTIVNAYLGIHPEHQMPTGTAAAAGGKGGKTKKTKSPGTGKPPTGTGAGTAPKKAASDGGDEMVSMRYGEHNGFTFYVLGS